MKFKTKIVQDIWQARISNTLKCPIAARKQFAIFKAAIKKS